MIVRDSNGERGCVRLTFRSRLSSKLERSKAQLVLTVTHIAVVSAAVMPESDHAAASMAEPTPTGQAGQTAADQFTEHFQEAVPQQGNHLQEPESVPALQIKGQVHKAAWIKVGQHFPQVRRVNWSFTTAGLSLVHNIIYAPAELPRN